MVLVFLLEFFFFSFSQTNIQSFQPGLTNCPKSQKQADIWYFGDKAGIDFRSGTAVPLTDEDVMTSFKSSAVISDSVGNLLFFTDGKRVWNRNFQLMTNANALEGNVGVTQPSIIVPVPGNLDKYYIFTIDVMAFNPDNTYNTKGLKYTIIDLTMWGGTGDSRDTMNFPLLTPVCQKLTAVKHGNNRDFWIIVHQWNSNSFYAYLLQSTGLSSPVISSVGTSMGGGFLDQTNAYGFMKASPDGKHIGLAISGMSKVELYDFNNSTGVISNPQSYATLDPGLAPYGVEFSSDSKKFYYTMLQITGNGPPSKSSRLYQFDLSNGFTTPVLIDSLAGIRSGGIQLATDGRIYVSRTVNILNKRDSLDVIYNPTRPGTECNFNLLNNVPDSRFDLSGRKSIYGLPNFVQSYFDLSMFNYDSVCKGDMTRFTIINPANIDTILWDFGDGNTSASMTPMHAYARDGSYLVKLTETFNGKNYTDSLRITIHKLPPVQLGDTLLLYVGSSINLHAGGGCTQYEWSTGSVDSIISVENEGNYWVKVEDYNCCYNTDSVYVELFRYYAPTAFTPNGDGKNDDFKLIGLYKDIKIDLYIHDRWGQIVFHSNKLDEGWDGTKAGQPCPADIYVWRAYINFLGQDIITKGDVILKGTVTLLK